MVNLTTILMLKLLRNKGIPEEKRNKIFEKYETFFNIIIFNKTNILDMALDEDLCSEARKYFCNRYHDYYKYRATNEDREKLDEYLYNKNVTVKELDNLSSAVGSNFLTEKICDKLFPLSFDEYLENMCDIDTFVTIYKSHADYINLAKVLKNLSLTVNVELYEKIINIKPNDDYYMYRIFTTDRIADSMKLDVIKRYVNKNNINRLLTLIDSNEEYGQIILDTKKDMIDDMINNLTTKGLIKVIDDDSYCKYFYNKLLNERKDFVISTINQTKPGILLRFVTLNRNDEISKVIMDNCKNKLIDYIKRCDFFYLNYILENKYDYYGFKNELLKYRKSSVIKYIKKASDFYLMNMLEASNSPKELVSLILKYRIDTVKKEYSDLSTYELNRKLENNMSTEIKELIINLNINENNIIDVLNSINEKCAFPEETISIIIESKRELLENILNKYSLDEFIKLKPFNKELKSTIYEKFENILSDIVKKEKIDKDTIIKIMQDNKYNSIIKKHILLCNGFNPDDIDNFLELYSCFPSEKTYNSFNKIKLFIESNNIDFDAFIQYGIGNIKYSSWLDNLYNILDLNKEDEFNKVCEYFFNNYYDCGTNQIKKVSCFLETLTNYTNNYNLCMMLTSSNCSLNDIDKTNLSRAFALKTNIDIKSIDELSELINKELQIYIENLLNDDLDIDNLKSMFNKYVFSECKSTIKSINGAEGLIRLKHLNNDNEFSKLVDSIIPYIKIYETVNSCKNKESLRDALLYIYNNDLFNSISSIYYTLDDKLRQLFEIDSMLNLTDLSKCESMIDEELSNEYGVPCYDFRNKNYCLYGHILSTKENMDDIMAGKSTSVSNFISVSAVSYLGQTYYYNYGKNILAYNKLLDGSFICSSMKNMGTNGAIKNNSSEVDSSHIHLKLQRGILETSCVTSNNSEALLYREGLIPCGLILPGGRKPFEKELEYSKKYNLPFIITQNVSTAINEVEMNIEKNDIKCISFSNHKEIDKIMSFFNKKTADISSIYTGREIALFADAHSLYEPTLAILEDIRKRGISEIYSLGDNIGLGPNPSEVFDMLESYGVNSIMGNSEYYCTLGTEPFSYLNQDRLNAQEWTENKLGSDRINKMKLWTPSQDILVGDKTVGLCHFANDVRWDFGINSTWSYQNNFEKGKNSNQFRYTNSDDAIKYMKSRLGVSETLNTLKGIKDALNNPIFNGKRVTDYDSIIQGHVHFNMEDYLDNTSIYTLRASGVGYDKDKRDTACYYILKEKKDGTFDVDRVLVKFNKQLLTSNINSSNIPDKSFLLRML